MTALLSRPRRAPSDPDPARTLETLATILITVLTIAILYLAREILVPIAIAILLSFVLSPPVRLLRKIGLGKRLSVGFVVCATFLLAVTSGAILAKQISDLAAEAPKYQATVTRKLQDAEIFAAESPALAKLKEAIAGVAKLSPAQDDKTRPGAGPAQAANPRPDQADGKPRAPMPVEIVAPAPGVLTVLQTVAGTAATPLATAAFVAIFIVFILLQREDLRNRFIRLVGFGDLHRTTLAMDDAGSRLARYFLAQVLLNLGFGVVVAVALAIIGVPSAILWGIVAMVMRFIPYVGSLGAALFPVLMAAASSAGWTMAIETAVFFVILELVVGQAIEPLLYGHNTGMSPIAVVVSATFWTWLWGPIGLVLSTPLTVCLVVLGRHVDRLAFLDVILGSAPALTPAETFYQRMLAGDPAEIVDHAETFLRDNSLLAYSDQVAMKALLMAQEDAHRGALSGDQQMLIRDMMRDLVEDMTEATETDREPEPAEAVPSGESAPAIEPVGALPQVTIAEAWRRDGAVTCVAARTPLDEAAAHLLADLLRRNGIGARVAPVESLTADAPDGHAAPLLMILSTLDADLKIAQARFAVRRLRRRGPDVPVVVAFWMSEPDDKRLTGLCADVRCDLCVATLPAAMALCLERAAESDEPTSS